MNYVTKNFYTIFVIVIGFILILFINNKAENVLDINKIDIKTVPDNFFNKVKYVAMDFKGNFLYKITSPTMKQFYESEIIETEKPNILLFRKDMPPIKVTSNFASIEYKKHNIKLSGDVKMYFQKKLSEPSLLLNTDNIYIRLDQQLAETDSIVHINKGDSYLNGKGMKCNLTLGEFTIFKDTRGNYVQ